MPPNKGMKQTKPGQDGASQLMPSFGRTMRRARGRLQTLAAGTAVLLALAGVGLRSPTRSADWWSSQESKVAEAIIADLAEMPPDQHDPADIRKCACVFVGLDATGYHDPLPEVVAALRARGIDAYAMSKSDRWRVTATHERAQYLGVVTMELKDRDIVVAEGMRLLGILAGSTWRYTLSYSPERWRVDTVRIEKIF